MSETIDAIDNASNGEASSRTLAQKGRTFFSADAIATADAKPSSPVSEREWTHLRRLATQAFQGTAPLSPGDRSIYIERSPVDVTSRLATRGESPSVNETR